jgi:hypothetical protein
MRQGEMDLPFNANSSKSPIFIKLIMKKDWKSGSSGRALAWQALSSNPVSAKKHKESNFDVGFFYTPNIREIA